MALLLGLMGMAPVNCMAARARLELTPLGATLTNEQRSQLKEAAQRVISGGANRWPSYTEPGSLANYYAPDDNTDPRRHYGSQYVRDFTYTFTMASDVPVLANGSDIPNILDYLMSGQDAGTGEMPEGGVPPGRPGQNCWDNGPFLAKAVASYALLYDDLPYLCGVHRQTNTSRVAMLLRGLEFLDVPLREGEPHLVVSPGACMYGFTDCEHKRGHVLYTSLLLIEGAQLMADALLTAAADNVRGCEASLKLEQPFLALAAAINDTIASSSSPLEDRTFGSGLLLATDSVGHNSLPDVWGSGLAVQIGAGTDAQRVRIQAALAANASRIFRWGQARHLIWPMCWDNAAPYPGFMNTNLCTETGGAPGSVEHSWCGGKPCGFYQNGGYWSTPLGWLLPAVARANFSLAAEILQAALNDSFANGFNEAVNHEAHYNPPQKYPPQTYQGVHGYLASVASIYGTVWAVRRGAAPSPPLPPAPPTPTPTPGACVDCQRSCVAPPALPSGGSMCSNLTGRWTGTWTGSYVYNVLESASHEVTFCSDLTRDCWSTATGLRAENGSIQLTFHRCQPSPDVSKPFTLDRTCTACVAPDGNYTRLKCDDGAAESTSRYVGFAATGTCVCRPDHMHNKYCNFSDALGRNDPSNYECRNYSNIAEMAQVSVVTFGDEANHTVPCALHGDDADPNHDLCTFHGSWPTSGLLRQPLGRRVLWLDFAASFAGRNGSISAHPKDLVVLANASACPNDQNSIFTGIWWDHGAAAVAAQAELFFPALHAAGGTVDQLVLDFELSMLTPTACKPPYAGGAPGVPKTPANQLSVQACRACIEEKWRAIQNDRRFAAQDLPKLQEMGFQVPTPYKSA